MSTDKGRIFVALDTTDIDAARALASRLKGSVGGAKLGLEFFTANGAAGVRAVRAAVRPRPKILNVHAASGPAMMRAADDAATEATKEYNLPRPPVVAVTVLTSLDSGDFEAVDQIGPPADQKRTAGPNDAVNAAAARAMAAALG